MFSYVPLEARIPADHPLRPMLELVDGILARLAPEFRELYSTTGRPSVAPERLLRALLLQVLYSVRSERLLMEQLEYNLLFRWFVGLGMDEPVWNPTVFSKNRDRLLGGKVADLFFAEVVAEAKRRKLLSDEHFTVDGTLIEAWAGTKSFRPRDTESRPTDDPGNPTVDFRGEKRRNETHASTTDPEARLYRKSGGTEAKLCYLGHVLMENRHGLAVESCVTTAGGTQEREAALTLIEAAAAGTRRITLGADRGYDTREFVEELRFLNVTPHVAQNDRQRRSAIDRRTTRHAGYALSQRRRKRVEEIFGWLKTVGLMRKVKLRGRRRVDWMFRFSTAVYNLVRIRNLEAAARA
jgi:transposase